MYFCGGALKQGRKHGNPVADDWAEAVMRKPLAIQKCYGLMDRPTDRPTRQVVESTLLSLTLSLDLHRRT